MANNEQLDSREDCLLELINDAGDGLRNLMERWENRLTFESVRSLTEEYRKGRLSLICYAERPLERRLEQVIINDISAGTHQVCLPLEPLVIGLVYQAYIPHLSDRQNGRQEFVLISNIQPVQSIDGVIPSFVRLYPVKDEVHNVHPYAEDRRLFFSCIDLSYQFVPFFEDGKPECSIGLPSRFLNSLISQSIKSRSKIVYSITNDQGQFSRGTMYYQFTDIVTSLRIFIDRKAVKVSLDESIKKSLKLLDVLVGPFDL